jgi:hypothetical protein
VKEEAFVNWIWLAVILAALGTAFGVGRGLHVSGKDPLSVSRLLKGGREGVRLLLERVEREEAPDFIMGAMCYRPAMAPDRVEYICPVCGERTWFAGQTGETIHREAEPMRRAIAELDGNPFFRATLDETLFCANCTGELNPENPRFILNLVYTEGDTVSTPVELFDLRMLVGLVKGELVFTDSYDARLPLKDGAARLRRLLGVGQQQGER